MGTTVMGSGNPEKGSRMFYVLERAQIRGWISRHIQKQRSKETGENRFSEVKDSDIGRWLDQVNRNDLPTDGVEFLEAHRESLRLFLSNEDIEKLKAEATGGEEARQERQALLGGDKEKVRLGYYKLLKLMVILREEVVESAGGLSFFDVCGEVPKQRCNLVGPSLMDDATDVVGWCISIRENHPERKFGLAYIAWDSKNGQYSISGSTFPFKERFTKREIVTWQSKACAVNTNHEKPILIYSYFGRVPDKGDVTGYGELKYDNEFGEWVGWSRDDQTKDGNLRLDIFMKKLTTEWLREVGVDIELNELVPGKDGLDDRIKVAVAYYRNLKSKK